MCRILCKKMRAFRTIEIAMFAVPSCSFTSACFKRQETPTVFQIYITPAFAVSAVYY